MFYDTKYQKRITIFPCKFMYPKGKNFRSSFMFTCSDFNPVFISKCVSRLCFCQFIEKYLAGYLWQFLKCFLNCLRNPAWTHSTQQSQGIFIDPKNVFYLHFRSLNLLSLTWLNWTFFHSKYLNFLNLFFECWHSVDQQNKSYKVVLILMYFR